MSSKSLLLLPPPKLRAMGPSSGPPPLLADFALPLPFPFAEELALLLLARLSSSFLVSCQILAVQFILLADIVRKTPASFSCVYDVSRVGEYLGVLGFPQR